MSLKKVFIWTETHRYEKFSNKINELGLKRNKADLSIFPRQDDVKVFFVFYVDDR